ncbi:MAG TPA: C39 family peptidase [Neobacillus sp.]
MKHFFLLASLLPILDCDHFAKNSSFTAKHQTTIPMVAETIFPFKLPKKNSAMLDVIVINQNPELKYGCEVTSLAMVLNYAGVKTDKMELYRMIQKETDPLIRTSKGNIISWGNPEYGFVGDMTGRFAGTTVFEKPLISLVNQKLTGRAVNLTNQPFERILEHVSEGYPVVVWTTLDFDLPKRWETWNHGEQVVRVPFDLHAVVLVGYDEHFVYINDPRTGEKKVRVEKEKFISSWISLNSRAVSYH